VWIFCTYIHPTDLEAFLKSTEGYVLLGGHSPRAPHIVVANRDGVAHDPNPAGGHLDPIDGTYMLGILAKVTV
jgi:hypothetical protein